MFLLFPSLIHRPHLPADARKALREMDITKPEDEFVNLPSSATIFQDLRMYQNVALTHLVAKGILSTDIMREGVLSMRAGSLPEDLSSSIEDRNRSDSQFAAFLVNAWKDIPLRGTNSMYRRIGLPVRTMAA